MYVGFAKVAYRAKSLQIFQSRFAALAPWDYVVNVKLNAGSERRTCTAGTTGEAVTLKHMPAKGLGLLCGGQLLCQAELRVI